MWKYPKTPRLESGLKQDHDGRLTVVVTEKVDGANVGIHFESGRMVLQSRGHELRGGPRERLFDRFKAWAGVRDGMLREALGARYVLFGEWLGVTHRIFYDALPDYFLVLDILDKKTGEFLSMDRRRQIIGLPEPPVLYKGPFRKASNLSGFIGPSAFKTRDWRQRYSEAAQRAGVRSPWEGVDDSDLMEGVYVKLETENIVVDRMKHPRGEYEKLRDADDWWGRPFVENQIRRA